MPVSQEILAETLELAQELIRIPSFNPPGNETPIATFARDWLLARGVTSQLVALEDGRSSLVARIPGRMPGSIVLCGHLDTVSADDASWSTPALVPAIKDGRLYGLGAADMKSAVAVLMQTMAQVARSERPPPSDIVMVLTADEEWGYRGAATVAKSGLIDDAEMIVIAEPTRNLIHRGQKGELWIEVTFTGAEAHGSRPEVGVNAILPAAQFCAQLKQSTDKWLGEYLDGHATLNIGKIHGGRQVNVVPAMCRIELDARVVSEKQYDHMLKTIERIGKQEAKKVGGSFAFRVMSYHPPIARIGISPWWNRLMKAAQRVCGDGTFRSMTPYSTDAVSFAPRLDCPILICGPGDIAQAHQPDEYIEIEQIEESLRLFLVALETD